MGEPRRPCYCTAVILYCCTSGAARPNVMSAESRRVSSGRAWWLKPKREFQVRDMSYLRRAGGRMGARRSQDSRARAHAPDVAADGAVPPEDGSECRAAVLRDVPVDHHPAAGVRPIRRLLRGEGRAHSGAVRHFAELLRRASSPCLSLIPFAWWSNSAAPSARVRATGAATGAATGTRRRVPDARPGASP